jgi:GDP-4-dehydro-6-deoxy-D-mannose reductase
MDRLRFYGFIFFAAAALSVIFVNNRTRIPLSFPIRYPPTLPDIDWKNELQKQSLDQSSRKTLSCERWVVVTTNRRLSDSIMDFSRGDGGWCLVVVGGEGTPSIDFGENTNAFFLGKEKQSELSLFSEVIELLPWNLMQRKNIGYLFAIMNGAKWIWDFEDETILIDETNLSPPTSGKRVFMKSYGAECYTFNPYPHFGATRSIWPRGYPPTLIMSNCEVNLINGTMDDVAVFQSLINSYPDVDGLFRLTHTLPFSFLESSTNSLVIPNGTFSPYNSFAQLSMYSAFWGLLLPVSVNSRVSDIWRSYITQRLLWDIGLRIAFTPPQVVRKRYENSPLEVFQEENDIYLKSLELVFFLREWQGTESLFPARYEELYIELYKRGYLDLKDVILAQKWILALIKIRYVFPPISDAALAITTLLPPFCAKVSVVFITGVSGMIGSHVARELVRRPCYKVFGLVRPRSNLDSLAGVLDKISLLIGDITDAVRINELMKQVRPDYVYHFAAQAINGISYSVPELTLDTNVLGTFNVLESILIAGLQKITRVLVAGSSTEYGRTADIWEGPIPEEAPLEPVSPYGVSKVATENLAHQYFLSHGVKAITARFFIQVGVGGTDSLAIHQFCKQIAMAERGLGPAVVKHGNLDTRRDMTDARDSSSAVIALLETGKLGEAYNVGSGNAMSISELLRIAVQNSKIKIETQADESRFRVYDEKMLLSDPSKLTKLTGWVPSTDMTETVTSILEYWRRRVQLLYPKEL